MSTINLLVAVELKKSVRYRQELAKETTFNINIVTNIDQVHQHLKDRSKSTGVLVLDNALGDVYEVVKALRQAYPNLLIIEVDEEADFSLPGQSDDVSNTPFENDDLIKKIKRLVEDRRLETLRADSLPSVRSFAKSLMQAKGGIAKTKAAVDAVMTLGFDYVAFFKMTPTDPPSASVVAQDGDDAIKRMAPQKLSHKSIIGHVAETGETKIISPDDEISHPFVARGKFRQGIAVPVGNNMRFGVLFAAHEGTDEIQKESVLMVELISAQLASALARDNSGQ
jgi:GAF domain-containing protein